MSKFIVAAFLIALVGVAHGSDPFASIRDKVARRFQIRELMKTRASDQCSLPTSYPLECEQAFADLVAVFITPDFADIDLNQLASTMDVICTDYCIGPEIEYYDCLDAEDLADLANNGYCGQSGGTNCVVLWVSGIAMDPIGQLPICASGGSCDAECEATVQNITDYLGCCAYSLYKNPEGPLVDMVTPEDLESCAVDFGEACADVYTGGVNHVESGLLVIFVVAAVLVNSALF